MSTAIATRDDLTTLLSTPITTALEYSARLQQFAKHNVNLLSPFSSLSGLAPQHELQPVQVFLDPDPDCGDVYGNPVDKPGLISWLKGDRAPAKNGLLKIGDAFGARIKLEYISVGTIRHYWHVGAVIAYRDIDGSMQIRSASQEWDLRDGSDRMKGWTPNMISEGRKNGLRQCETRAINAALRQCGAGVKQKYSVEDLQKPFVVFRVVFKPDMSDPVQRRMVTERAFAGTSALFPGSRREIPETIDVGTGEVLEGEQVPAQNAAGATPQHVATAPAQTAGADMPPCEGAVRIVSVTPVTGKKADGKPWIRWDVADSSGLKAATFKEPLAQAAKSFEASKAWVMVATESKEVGGRAVTALLEISPATTSTEDEEY